jgi:hypothetical protein
VQALFGYVYPVDEDPAFFQLSDATDAEGKSALACTSAADNAHLLAGLDVETKFIENYVCPWSVPHHYIVELDRAGLWPVGPRF